MPTRLQPIKTLAAAAIALLLCCAAAAQKQEKTKTPPPAQQPETPKREENIVVTQPKPGEENDQVKARAALNSMYNALGGARWLNRGDYVLQGHTSSFYKNAPTGVGDFLQFHHVLPANQWEDRIELTKKRDIVQVWTTTEGVEVTYKGRKPLPKEQQEEYFRRIKYSLDTIANVWLKDPATLLIYGGTAVVARISSRMAAIMSARKPRVAAISTADPSAPAARPSASLRVTASRDTGARSVERRLISSSFMAPPPAGRGAAGSRPAWRSRGARRP